MNQAVEFDFATRKTRPLSPGDVPATLKAGKACWLDLDVQDRSATERVLRELGVNDLAIEQALADDAASRLVTHEDCLHVRANAVKVKDDGLEFSRLDLIVSRSLFISLHAGPVDPLEKVRRTYETDFERFAKSLGFMLYEVFDRLIDGYRKAIRATEAEAQEFQGRIFGTVDDSIFTHVSHANRDLLALRASLLAVRDLLAQLATRRSEHVAETTQPFLESLLGSVERLGADLTIARDILSESLDLYMSLVSHRTNQVVTRLTIFSVVFLPLTFLCGVYGMNFKHQPEFDWTYGYAMWWALAVSVAAGLAAFMKRRRWL